MQEEFALNALHVQNTITSAGPRSNRCSASNVLFFVFFFLHHPVKKLNCFILNTKKKRAFWIYTMETSSNGS